MIVAWDIPLSIGGPVLRWELVRLGGQRSVRLFRYGYLAMIAAEMFFMLLGYWTDSRQVPQKFRSAALAQITGPLLSAEEERAFAASITAMFLYQQLFLLVLVTPIISASNFGQDKERNAIADLLS
jgi:hypothetical protein